MAYESIKTYRQEHEQDSSIPSNPIDDENYTESMICQPWILFEFNLVELYIRHVSYCSIRIYLRK
jgi:hypothetical protein